MNIQIEIKKPLWDKRKVGLARYKLIGDMVNVIIQYRNKEGKLLFPHVYQISCSKARQYPIQVVKGVELHIVPIADMRAVAVREEAKVWQ